MTHYLKHGGLALLLTTLAAASLLAQQRVEKVNLELRYGIPAKVALYPQRDPQETVRSVIRATRAGEISYMLAQLISPSQVDEKLDGNRAALGKLAAKATSAKSKKMIAALEQQLKSGTWTVERDLAWSRVDGLPVLSLEKIGDRWFMHNTPVQKPQ